MRCGESVSDKYSETLLDRDETDILVLEIYAMLYICLLIILVPLRCVETMMSEASRDNIKSRWRILMADSDFGHFKLRICVKRYVRELVP
jgi:hypothetical protein